MCVIGSHKHTRRISRPNGHIAYRAFSVCGGTLRPVFQNSPIFGVTDNRSSEPVKKGTRHGFWSYRTFARALQKHRGYLIVRVLVYGTVAAHTYGYRSSRLDLVAIVGYRHVRSSDLTVARGLGLPVETPRG